MKRSHLAVVLSIMALFMMMSLPAAIAGKPDSPGKSTQAKDEHKPEKKPHKTQSEPEEQPQAQPKPDSKQEVEPQPVATKDRGANTSGDFDATDPKGARDEGGYVAGTKGKADDKNPPGQSRNDHNNGYECDGNSGIGDGPGNPAHTGCTETETETEPPTIIEDPCEAFGTCPTPTPTPSEKCVEDCDKDECDETVEDCGNTTCEVDCDEDTCVEDCGETTCVGVCGPPVSDERLPETGLPINMVLATVLSLLLIGIGFGLLKTLSPKS